MKEKSKAYLKAEAHRDAINKGRQKILAKDLSSVVFIYNNVKGQPCATGYRGKALSPAINYRYSSEERRSKAVAEWMASVAENAGSRRKAAPRDLKVDDVLRCSWGYDQTNIDYYQVVRLVGKQSVEIREISQERKYDAMDRGECVPAVNEFIGEPMIKKVDGDRVKIYDFASAYKMNPVVNVVGAKVYESSCWSSYH